jgi:hypothetical protein
MPENDSEAVAEFIRTKGITRCPTACVLPTQGLVTAADRAAPRVFAPRVHAREGKASKSASLPSCSAAWSLIICCAAPRACRSRAHC